MEKDKAREELDRFLTAMAQDDFYNRIRLPIKDCRVISKTMDNGETVTVSDYTFMYLLKTAYGLTEKE